MRRRSCQLFCSPCASCVAFFVALPRLVDEDQNKVVNKPPYSASARAFNLHKQLTIADLHADSLLWGRDLLERSTYGQVDIPRLADGNVALQVFSLPTKSPHGLNIESNEDKHDDIFWLAIADRWPPQPGPASPSERCIMHAACISSRTLREVVSW